MGFVCANQIARERLAVQTVAEDHVELAGLNSSAPPQENASVRDVDVVVVVVTSRSFESILVLIILDYYVNC